MVITLSDNEREATWRKEVRSFIDSEAPAALKAAGDEGGENSLFGRLGAIKECEQFIMNEEFAEARARQRRRLRRHDDRPDDHRARHEEQKRSTSARSFEAKCSGARATASRAPARTSPRLQTRAVRDGDDFVINGQKIWTSGAHNADWMFMLAAPTRMRRSTAASPTS
jgi:hypothetical protein